MQSFHPGIPEVLRSLKWDRPENSLATFIIGMAAFIMWCRVRVRVRVVSILTMVEFLQMTMRSAHCCGMNLANYSSPLDRVCLLPSFPPLSAFSKDNPRVQSSCLDLSACFLSSEELSKGCGTGEFYFEGYRAAENSSKTFKPIKKVMEITTGHMTCCQNVNCAMPQTWHLEHGINLRSTLFIPMPSLLYRLLTIPVGKQRQSMTFTK